MRKKDNRDIRYQTQSSNTSLSNLSVLSLVPKKPEYPENKSKCKLDDILLQICFSESKTKLDQNIHFKQLISITAN